ncbi:MAG: hypothetical protein IKX23_08630 [Treponema sp.]|nr:hypothetical protein [Treponema sp.]
MDKNRRNKKKWNNQRNNQKNNQQTVNETNKYEDESVRLERQKAISEIKAREVLCAKCGNPITEITSCMSDKESGKPIHFECAIGEVEKSEKLLPNEKIAYIGQGRFGILSYENPRDQRHFTIKKVIEWDDKEKKSEWREEISGLYSKVN